MSIESLTDEELQTIAETITEEEFEALDELSQDTLKSYIKKADADVGKQYSKGDKAFVRARSAGEAKDKVKDSNGRGRRGPAYRKLDKKEEELDSKANKYYKKAGNRESGAVMATNKLKEELSDEELQNIVETITEEEFEALDELSKKTLGTYIAKNSIDSMNKGGKPDLKTKDLRKTIKRREGFTRAVDKINKKSKIKEDFTDEELQTIAETITEEEFESLDEISKDTLSSYVSKASSNASRSMDISKFAKDKIKDFSKGGDAWAKKIKSQYKDEKDSADKNVKKRGRGLQMAGRRMAEDISDLLGFTVDKEPVNFGEKFGEIMVDKIAERIEDKRIEIASNLYSDGEAVEESLNVEDFDIDLDLEDLEESLDITDDQLQEIVDNITEEEFEALDEETQEILADLIDEANKINKEKARAFRAGTKRKYADKMPSREYSHKRWAGPEEKKAANDKMKEKKEGAKDKADKMKLHAKEKIRAAGGKSGSVVKAFNAGKKHEAPKHKDVGNVDLNNSYKKTNSWRKPEEGDDPNPVGKHLHHHRTNQIEKNSREADDIHRKISRHLDDNKPTYHKGFNAPSEDSVKASHAKLKKLKDLHKSITGG